MKSILQGLGISEAYNLQEHPQSVSRGCVMPCTCVSIMWCHSVSVNLGGSKLYQRQNCCDCIITAGKIKPATCCGSCFAGRSTRVTNVAVCNNTVASLSWSRPWLLIPTCMCFCWQACLFKTLDDGTYHRHEFALNALTVMAS